MVFAINGVQSVCIVTYRGKVDGYTLFVKDAIIGDTVEAVITKPKKNYAYAKMINIIEPSKHRVPAKCPVARQCGGCQIQELS